jgi:hypothetical protein
LRNSDPQPVGIWVGQVNFATPGLLVDLDVELLRNGLDVLDPEINQSVRLGVARVLRQEQASGALASNGDERREPWFKPVFPFPFIAQTLVPGNGFSGIFNSQNWDGFFHELILIRKGLPPQNDGRGYWEITAPCS